MINHNLINQIDINHAYMHDLLAVSSLSDNARAQDDGSISIAKGESGFIDFQTLPEFDISSCHELINCVLMARIADD